MGLYHEVVNINELTEQDMLEMFHLMAHYYDNLPFDKFVKDFQSKNDVIVLKSDEKIYGFTSIELMPLHIAGKDIVGVFSGNTIVDLDHQVGSELQKGFIQYINEYMINHPSVDLYWFLICKGYKTYRYLSIYFDAYYPNLQLETPYFESEIMKAYASKKYNADYDHDTGIVKNSGFNDYLKEEVAPMTEKALKNPVIAYFNIMNPYHKRGDELVCLAKFSHDNLKPGFNRMVKRS